MQSTIVRVSEEALEYAREAVEALIGADLEASLQAASLIKKDGYLEKLSGRNIVIGLSMKGRYQGEGCLVVAETCAVRLAGKMLMLPTSELNEIINSANYIDEEEIRYAFDDVAKCLIIRFLEAFQRSSTFISTVSCRNQTVVTDRKEIADIISHLPEEQTYYQISATISVAGLAMDSLSLLLPAFVLVCSEPFQKSSATDLSQTGLHPVDPDSDQLDILAEHVTAESEAHVNAPLIAKLCPVLQSELGAMLDVSVRIKERKSIYGSLPLLQEKTSHLELCTRMEISGAVENQAWLISSTKDALRLGLLLTDGPPGLMIPDSAATTFSADRQDGYEEISSVVIDALDQLVGELSNDELALEKDRLLTSSESLSQVLQDESSREQNGILSVLEVAADSLVVGTLHLLLPVDLYEGLRSVEPMSLSEDETANRLESFADTSDGEVNTMTGSQDRLSSSAKILLVEASAAHHAEIRNTLEQAGIKSESIALSDELGKAQLDELCAVLVVAERLDEIGLGMVIKIKSRASTPLIVAASQWTQADVMKALRYGVDDILVLPAEKDELLQKLRRLEQLTV